MLGDDLGDPLGGLQGGGAEVDAAAAGGEGGGERGVVADAAGQLDLDVHGAGHFGDEGAVVAGAEGGVQVDEVQPLGAGALPGECGLQRGAVGGLGAGLAVHQADRLAVADVYGGEQFKLRHYSVSIQLVSSWAPASPDFSGWNWVAHSAPFSTAATKRSPCVAQVTLGARILALVTSRDQSCAA